MRYCYTLLLVCIISLSFGQQVNQSDLDIKTIMQGEDFVGYLPSNIRWVDNKTIAFSWNPDLDTLRSTYVADIQSTEVRKLNMDELKLLPPASMDYSDDGRIAVYAKNGDLFIRGVETGNLNHFFNTVEVERQPTFTPDDRMVVYISGDNYFTWDIVSGKIRQLTQFKSGKPRTDKKISEQEQWLEDDQLEYFDILRQRSEVKEIREKRNEALQPDRPKEIYYGKDRLTLQGISPDLRYVVYRITKDAKSERTLVPDYVTQSGKVENLYSRSKVGSSQNTYESWVFDIKRDTNYMILTKEIHGIYDKPSFMKDYAEENTEYVDTFATPREVIINGPLFSESGEAIVVVRSMDNKDRWIMQLDLESGDLHLLDRQRDEAWVGGPGVVGWNFSTGTLGWINDHTIYYQSEKTGYSHLYSQDIKTGKQKTLTSGDFEVLSAQLSKDKKTFYLTTNEVSPHEQHFYHMAVTGGERTKLTDAPGAYQITVSPDENHVAVRYSYTNQPWELFVMENKPGAILQQLTFSTTDAFHKYPWREPEIINFKARDGKEVKARLYRPEESKKNGAGVVFVHGAGYLQNVHRRWSSYYREYMFHNFLADNGYTVIDIDYRASAGYGRDWRTAIYRWMGGYDLNDNVDGAKYLIEEHGIDPDRIGMYGGSYGGFITIMAMFTAPDVFACGAALRSVTDWAHYNHGYTSNILNTPIEDPDAFRKSSPIYHAKGLEGNLLMLHGVVDRNVQFQDVVRLSQRLIELEKENWELAVFPMEGHGFVEPSSWTDEYRRIYELFQEHLAK